MPQVRLEVVGAESAVSFLTLLRYGRCARLCHSWAYTSVNDVFKRVWGTNLRYANVSTHNNYNGFSPDPLLLNLQDTT